MTDYNKKSVIQISRLNLGQISLDDDRDVEGASDLDDFLQNENDWALCAYLDNRGGLKFSKTLPDFECEKSVIFSKRNPLTAESEDFLKKLQINTVSGTPTLDLFEFLNTIFSPRLQKHYDKSIKRKIFTLQSNLKSVILTENSKYPFQQENNFAYVNSVEDEIKYLNSIVASKTDKLTRKSAENFVKVLKPVAKDLSIIESLPVNEVEDLLERCHNTLDDLWRCEPSFPKDRIKNLMDIIGFDVWKHTVKQFQDCDVWKNEYNKVSEKSMQSLSIGEKWLTTCKQLTALFWPNYSSNPWKEVAYQPAELVQFVSTLREASKIEHLGSVNYQNEINAKNSEKLMYVPNWFNMDLKTGMLTIHLGQDEVDCFSAWVSAKDAGIRDHPEPDHKVNYGKLLLQALFEHWRGVQTDQENKIYFSVPKHIPLILSEIGGRTLYRVLVGDTSGETENALLNETVPNWVISNIEDNCTSKFTKVQFYLKPHASVPSNLLKQDRLKKPDRLVANDFIQCRKVAEHVLDKLLGEGTATSPGGEGDSQTQSSSGYTVDQIQLICSDQPVDHSMDLRTVKHFMWKYSSDLVLYYKIIDK